jgi:hypothetical protein
LAQAGTQVTWDANQVLAYESASAVSLISDVDDFVSLKAKHGTSTSTEASSSSEETTVTEADILAEVQAYLPSVDFAYSNKTLLSATYAQASDLEGYTYLTTISFLNLDKTTKTLSLYYNIVEATSTGNETGSGTQTPPDKPTETGASTTAPTGTETSSATAGTGTASTTGTTQTGASATASGTTSTGTETSSATSTTGTAPTAPTQTGASLTDKGHGDMGPGGHNGKGGLGYTDRFADGKDEGDKEKLSVIKQEISGVIVYEGNTYQMAGRTGTNTDGKELTDFGFFYNDTDYIKVREMSDSDKTMFKCTVLSDHVVVSSYELGIFASDTETRIFFRSKDIDEDVFSTFTFYTESGEDYVKAQIKKTGWPNYIFCFKKVTATDGTITYELQSETAETAPASSSAEETSSSASV